MTKRKFILTAIIILIIAIAGFAVYLYVTTQQKLASNNSVVSQPNDFDPSLAEDAKVVTIYTLGDSLTAGDQDDKDQGGYPGRLQTRLKEINDTVQVTNLGRSGWSSSDLVNGIDTENPSQLDQVLAAKPKIACIWIGSNDLWYLYEFGNPTPADEQKDVENYRSNLDKIMKSLTQAGIKVFIAQLDDQSKRPVAKNKQAFPDITDAELARMSQQVERYNQVIKQKADEYKVTTVDFFNTSIFTDTATLAEDGNHPNGLGYDKVADIWFAALKSSL